MHMRAVHQSGYGGREQLTVREVARPSPGAGCVLVRVAAVSVNAGDHHMLTGRPYLIRAVVGHKSIPGMDFSGIVETSGAGVTQFLPGDHVFGTADVSCGAFAEYVCVPAMKVVPKPEQLSWEESAALPTAGMTAMQSLRVGRTISKGDRVLINGASGGVGTFAVQLARNAGAHVTAVCGSHNVEMVKSLGADVVIDYWKESIDSASVAAGATYEKVIDAVGRSGWRKLLSSHGEVVAVGLPNPESECVPCNVCRVACSPCCCCCFSSKKSHLFMQTVEASDMAELARMACDGELRPVLGLKLKGIEEVPAALAGHSASLGQGHRIGKTVVALGVRPESMDRHESEGTAARAEPDAEGEGAVAEAHAVPGAAWYVE